MNQSPLTPKDAERILRKERERRTRGRQIIASDGSVLCAVCMHSIQASQATDGAIVIDVLSQVERDTGRRDDHGLAITETSWIRPKRIRGWICNDCAYRFAAVTVSLPVDVRGNRRGIKVAPISHWNNREQRIAAQCAELEIEVARRNLIDHGMPEWAALYAAVEATSKAVPESGTWAHTGCPDWISWRLIYDRTYRWTADQIAHQWYRDRSYHWKLDPSEDVSNGRWRGFYIGRDPGLRGWRNSERIQPWPTKSAAEFTDLADTRDIKPIRINRARYILRDRVSTVYGPVGTPKGIRSIPQGIGALSVAIAGAIAGGGKGSSGQTVYGPFLPPAESMRITFGSRPLPKRAIPLRPIT